MSLFIRIDLLPEAQSLPAIAAACPVNIFSVDAGHVRVVADLQDECTLCEQCLDAAPPGAVRIYKLYSGAVLERLGPDGQNPAR